MCLENDIVDLNAADEELTLIETKRKKLKIDSSSNERDETESQKIKDDFSNSIQKIEEYGLDDRLNIQIINRYWSWLTFKINEENPFESTMSCSICKEHLNNLFVKDTNQFQGDVKIRQTKTENSRLLLDHQRSSGHLTTLRRLNKLKLTKTEEEIKNAVDASLLPELMDTYNSFKVCNSRL